MKTTYKAQITVQTDVEEAWNAITQKNFVKEFFPEIKKDISNLGEYVLRTHKNLEQLAPSYMVLNQAIGWANSGTTEIKLPRKDVDANIESIDILLINKGEYTTVKVEVNYSPKIGKNFFLAHRCVRGLIAIKLAVLKKDLELNNNQIGWSPAIA